MSAVPPAPRRALICSIVLALGALVLPAVPASAANAWDVPRDATVTVRGHGYGHGHGLSQYGAQRAAGLGKTYRQIVRFYYPGTRWGRAGGTVKVLLTADTTRDVVVRARSGLTLRSLGARRAWPLTRVAPRANRWRITPAARGRSIIAYRTKRWHTWRTVPGDAEFAAGGKPITLQTPAGARRYRGILRSASVAGRGRDRDTVNILSLESYLRGVVPLEVPALWHRHAVRAQAIAARTYAAFERAAAPSRHYQICDTAHCQVYGGHSAEHSASNAAVRATRKQVLTKGGRPIFAQFSASSGGWTSAGAFSYLKAKEDPYDRWKGNPHHAWRVALSDEEIEAQWPGIGNLTRIRVNRRDGNGDWNGRVEEMTLTGEDGSVTVSGDTFRLRFGLRSSWFTFRVS
ncbi:SpoIID/LytB domain-containing protein [Nocardioides sp.]|uniref:SpoIID/LytB domain-containing protein n=1 Tax=Nocardioides sp. TaxID=35761 RepID=UPI0035674FA2